MWNLQMAKKHISASWWAMQYSLPCPQKSFQMCLQKWKGCFLNTLHKNRESLVALQLPSDCWVIYWKTSSYYFSNKPTKKERGSLDKNVTWQGPNVERFFLYANLIWKCDLIMIKKEAYKSISFWLLNHCLSFIVKNYSLTSFTCQRAIFFIHGLQLYCFLGQVNW